MLELRALPLVERLATGEVLHLVDDADSLPHLRPGEFAVIDTTDREPVAGELFVIEWIGGRRSLVEAVRRTSWANPGEEPPWCVAAYNRPRSRAELDRWIAEGRVPSTVEGPFRLEHLRSKLVGRVVGLFVSGFDEARLTSVQEG